jgi:hypothetical protein
MNWRASLLTRMVIFTWRLRQQDPGHPPEADVEILFRALAFPGRLTCPVRARQLPSTAATFADLRQRYFSSCANSVRIRIQGFHL